MDPVAIGILFLVATVVVSIPVSLAINLATPRVDTWLSARSERRAADRAERDAQLEARARNLSRDPKALTAWLWGQLFVILRLALIGLMAIFLWILAGLGLGLSRALFQESNRFQDLVVNAVGAIALAWFFGLLLVAIGRTRLVLDTLREVRELERSNGMAQVMITCPVKKVAVPTGIAMSAQSWASTTMDGNSMRCPACGKTHVWDKKDAYLEDEPGKPN